MMTKLNRSKSHLTSESIRDAILVMDANSDKEYILGNAASRIAARLAREKTYNPAKLILDQ